MNKLFLSLICAVCCSGSFAFDEKHPSNEVYEFYMLNLSGNVNIEGDCDFYDDDYKYAEATYETTLIKVDLFLEERTKYTFSHHLTDLDHYLMKGRTAVLFLCNGDSYDLPFSEQEVSRAFILANEFVK